MRKGLFFFILFLLKYAAKAGCRKGGSLFLAQFSVNLLTQFGPTTYKTLKLKAKNIYNDQSFIYIIKFSK